LLVVVVVVWWWWCLARLQRCVKRSGQDDDEEDDDHEEEEEEDMGRSLQKSAHIFAVRIFVRVGVESCTVLASCSSLCSPRLGSA
jgi:hypothetical protein